MASTEEEITPPVDHSTPKQFHKTFGHELEDCQERKSLQTLQQSALDDTALVGIGVTHSKHGKSAEKPKFRPSHGQVKLYHDNSNLVNVGVNKATQTDDSLLEDLIQQRLTQQVKRDRSLAEDEENEAFELMVREPVPESYWKEVAEQRRLALSDTLEENKSLHQSVESLKEENEKLLELASQAEQLSSLLQSVVSDDEGEEKNTQSEDNEGGGQTTNDANLDPENDPGEPSTRLDPLKEDPGEPVQPESKRSESKEQAKLSAGGNDESVDNE